MTNKHFYIAFPAIYCNAVCTFQFTVYSFLFSFRTAYQSTQQRIIGELGGKGGYYLLYSIYLKSIVVYCSYLCVFFAYWL